MKHVRAEMGIGTLIIFVALLLVAAVAAAVLINTAGSLQERALTTGDQAKSQISTNVKVTEVSGVDGLDGALEVFEEVVKLSPGSGEIKLEQTLITMSLFDSSASLTYRGVGGVALDDIANGYYTLQSETLGNVSTTPVGLSEDFDLDGSADQVAIVGDLLTFIFSSGVNYSVPGVNCSGAAGDVSMFVEADSSIVDTVVINGSCGGDQLNDSAALVVVTPLRLGEGFYVVEYLQRGTNPVDGNLQAGDIVRVSFEAPRAVGEDEEVRLNIVPRVGSSTLTQFFTPEVISDSRVYLYP